jgi:hypothetical protein
MGATSGPGPVVRSVKASPAPSGIGRQRPAKQNQSSPKLWRRPGNRREGMSGNLCRCGLVAALGALRRRAGLCFELLLRSVRANTGCRSSWSARLEHERPAAA